MVHPVWNLRWQGLFPDHHNLRCYSTRSSRCKPRQQRLVQQQQSSHQQVGENHCSRPAGGSAAAVPPSTSTAAPCSSSSNSSSTASSSGSQPPSLLRSELLALAKRASVAALAALLALPLPPVVPLPAGAVTEEQLLFLEAWRAVDRAYVDKSFNGQSWFRVREKFLKEVPMTNRRQTYDAVRQLLGLLGDPFTRLLDPDQYSALRSTTAGSVTGVGVEVSFSSAEGAGGNLVVVAPAPGGPADRAGIRPGDQILAIDGQPTSMLSLYAAGGLLQGPAGSSVVLAVQAPGPKGTAKEITLQREPIKINPVDSALCSSPASSGELGLGGGKLGYIRVASFAKPTAQAVREAITSLQAQGAEQYVLDIRSNGGGLFPAGVEVARMWVNRGDVVLIADSNGVRDIYEAEGSALEPTAPLTVLVNRGTASAAEVLAGALKDNARARIVGEPTFGKGLIQTLVPLSDGAALAVTVAKYQTPAGVDINKVGISPQVPLDPARLLEIPTSAPAFCEYVTQPREAPAPLMAGSQR